MKKILLLALLSIPILLSAQSKPGQKNKNIFEIIHPLQGQADNLEKGLSHHNQTFHKQTDPINVYEVLTGEQTGEYVFNYRNSYSWKDVGLTYKAAEDKDHAADWDQNVAKYASNNAPHEFYEVSTESYLPGDHSEMNSDLYGVYLIDLAPGKEDVFNASLKKIKEMYRKTNSKNYYLIQSRVFGKGNQVMVTFPLPNGWESLEQNPNEDWSVMFKKAFPSEDFKTWIKKFNDSQASFTSFVVKWRKDLSSPM